MPVSVELWYLTLHATAARRMGHSRIRSREENHRSFDFASLCSASLRMTSRLFLWIPTSQRRDVGHPDFILGMVSTCV